MKLLKNEHRKGLIKLEVTDPEDLWTLQRIIAKNDLVKSYTERKVKVGNSENAKVVRKPMVLELKVESCNYEPRLDSLRILGTITAGPEDAGKGDHHSFSIKTGDWLEIRRESFASYDLDRIEQACKPTSRILLLSFDREEANLALLTSRGLQQLLQLKGKVQKKQYTESETGNFFSEIAKAIEEQIQKTGARQVIAGSPGFWNEYLKKQLKPELTKITTWATCSDGSENSLKEIISRPEVHTVLKEDRTARETELIEKLLEAIGKEGACLGKKEVKEKLQEGNIKILLVSDELLTQEKEKNSTLIEELMKQAEAIKAEVHIIATEPAKRLDDVGGIAGILRWG